MHSGNKFLLIVGAGWVGVVFIAIATITFAFWSMWNILNLYGFVHMLLSMAIIGIVLLTPAIITQLKNKND